MSAINKINVDNVSYNIEDSRVDNIADAIPTASTEQKGLVQIGQGINVDENGVISVEASGGDSVSYTDGGTPASVVIGTLNINGTDYEIKAPWVQYQDNIGDRDAHTVLGTIDNGFGSQYDIIAPRVSYEDYAQGDPIGVLTVGENQYNITCSAASGDSVQFNSLLASGTQIGTITINGVDTAIYAPAGGSGGGDTVTVTPAVYSGTHIADINVSGNATSLYAPEQVQADWSETNINSKAYIPSKPAIEKGTPGSGTYQQASYAIQQSGNTASGNYSIAIGYDTQATNHCAVAVGGSTQATGMWSVATGDGTIAASNRQIAMGTYNTQDSNEYFAVMVGNGSVSGGRKNAEATAWNGNKYIEGDLYVGCTDWSTVDSSHSGTTKPELVTENAGGKRVLTEDDAVTVTQTLATGTKIAEIDVGGTTTDIYAPAGSATDWADITNKPDITPVAGRDGINNIAGLGGSVNQSQGINPKGTIVIGDIAKSDADFALVFGQSAEVTGSHGVALGFGAKAGHSSIGLQGLATGEYAAALGQTTAASQFQTAIGFNNIVDSNGQFGLIVGNGITGDNELIRSDAMAIGFDGTQYLAGDLYVNCTDFTTTDVGGGELNTANCGGTKVATLSDIKADWTITDASVVGYIANKPNINAGTGTGAIKEGNGSTASGNYSHAEGDHATASGSYSHAEGSNTSARGSESHVEGLGSVAEGDYSHAEGLEARANGGISHAEGRYTVAESLVSHAEGDYCEARANFSHVEGSHTKAYGITSHVQGKYNIFDQNSIFADIVGNGRTVSGSTVRSNAEATDWNGNKYLSGGIYVGCTDYTTTANGLTTLGAGGFRIDQAPDNVCPDPVAGDAGVDVYKHVYGVFVDSINKDLTWNYDQETGDPTDYTIGTTHDRLWIPLPDVKETLKGLEVEDGLNTGNYAQSFSGAGINGIWQLQAVVAQIQDPNDTTQLIPDVDNPIFMWKFVSADTSAWDATPDTPEEPDPEEEPTEEEPTE